jgi:hypothetical protein
MTRQLNTQSAVMPRISLAFPTIRNTLANTSAASNAFFSTFAGQQLYRQQWSLLVVTTLSKAL